ncbi:hypothetical protein G6F50_017333 [Rhizopus delemar]|uniref:Uncharacterized protein n=1 Tax=Rhizopus delemar TaxID=936053 RepID=A0A9P6XQM0_9FUNG|nr:hypothetical protein G6F50_017333 [Rhizopus delemar]
MRVRRGDQAFRVAGGKADQAVFIAHQDVAGLDDLAADGHGHVDFARAVLVGTAGDMATRIAGKAVGFERGHVTDGAINDDAGAAVDLQVALHDLAHHGVGQIIRLSPGRVLTVSAVPPSLPRPL